MIREGLTLEEVKEEIRKECADLSVRGVLLSDLLISDLNSYDWGA